MKFRVALPLLLIFLIFLMPSLTVLAQPSLSVEFYFPHYYNPTFRAQTNEQIIISKGFRGRGNFYGSIYITNEGGSKVSNLTLEVKVPIEEGFKVLRGPKGANISEDKSSFTYVIKSIDPGKTFRVSFQVAVPETLVSKVVSFFVVIKDQEGNVIFQEEYKRPFVPEPFSVYLATLIVSIVVIGGAFYAIEKGLLFGQSFKTKDLIYTTIFGVLLVIWVQIIGRSLGFFSMTNRLPIPFVNYAIGDVGYATLFVLGVLIVRKPGVATFMHLIYQFVSQLFWYGFDIRWYLYSIVEALPVDIYLAISNKFFLGGEGFAIPRPRGVWAVIDAAIIGGLRALFAWLSLYYVFYPYLNHFYTTTYVVFMHTSTITIFNMLFGIFLALPLFRVLERLIP